MSDDKIKHQLLAIKLQSGKATASDRDSALALVLLSLWDTEDFDRAVRVHIRTHEREQHNNGFLRFIASIVAIFRGGSL